MKSEEPQVIPHIDCAHMECNSPAICKLKTETGWAKVCYKHYLAHFQEKAEEKCVELGLLTPAMCREWVKNNGLRVKKFSEAA